jgi:hypothetical protein
MEIGRIGRTQTANTAQCEFEGPKLNRYFISLLAYGSTEKQLSAL